MSNLELWAARPVEVEAERWNGDFDALPPAWQIHPLIRWSGNRLTITTIEGDTGTPDLGDYIVWGTASELYWAPAEIHTERWKHIGGNRWMALPVETPAQLWTGDFDSLPQEWRDDPQFEMDSAGLALTNYRGSVTRPRPWLDYIVQRNRGLFSKVPRAIFEFKYGRVTP